ncbi:MAG: MT-A70 family methyltransferase [Patescibacteria group bacterium]|nr:MT-A70 family methyltransferase [Patescibacteria group bacterium]
MKEEKENIKTEPQETDNNSLSVVEARVIQQGGYRTILVDPPWQYGVWGNSYLTVEQIKAIPVKSLANKNCELYLWTTQKYLPDSFEVLKAWGFKYCQTLTWCKKPMGKGQGGVYTPTTEFLILARLGKMPKVERIDTTWWEVKRQNKHSKKPECFQDIIETVSEAPRLEMFARRYRMGWDVWGNEVESDISLAV